MDGVTIEDEFDSNEQIFSESPKEIGSSKLSLLFEILTQQWTIICLLLIIIFTFIYLKRNRKEKTNSTNNSMNHYEQMERIREKQQKQYEEQALRRAEEKKAKSETLKSSSSETADRLKYRSNDHNPLTGQSDSHQEGSCAWRPSSSRRKPAGG